MKSAFLLFLLVQCLVTLLNTQYCMNTIGQPISWWVILKVPPSIGNSGYAYYDSTMKTGTFQFINKTVDLDISPLSQTFSLINKDKLERIAWNDEKPDNTTSSTKAHAKGLISFGKNSGRGFFIVHSIPKYPAFLSDHTLNISIPKAEQVYGQHISCFSLSLYQLNNMAANLLVIHPNIYQSTIVLRAPTQNLYELSLSCFPINHDLFKHYEMKPEGYYIKSIYKNNQVNGSIFEDGLARWSSGKVFAQTWGRPLQSAWCSGTYEVKNVLQIKINQKIQWDESKDHSKWAIIGNSYSCFGDMNRMTSQWKRGGAFYCLNDATLNAAMQKITIFTDYCQLQTDKQQVEIEGLNLQTE